MNRCLAITTMLVLCGCASPEREPEPATEGPAASAEPAVRGWELPSTPSEPVTDVVLITLDTLRADALGFMGNDRVATPALDRLAAAGWAFDDARAHNVVTLPSHANILSGRHPYEHGVRDNSGFVLPETVPTLATELSRAGFATAAFVAAFPLDSRFGLARGFDVYDDDYQSGSGSHEMDIPERPGAEVVRLGLEWWNRTEGKRFLWLHLYEPHSPYLAPEPYGSRHRDEPYLGEVEVTDAYLAPLLEEVTTDSAATTLVLMTSDHGEALGDHGEVTHGLFAYEATIRVPLVIWGGGMGAGRSDYPARHVDLLPTVLEAAGVAVPDGVSGIGLFSGAADGEAAPQYFESLTPTFDSGFAPLRGVVAEGFKFISLPLPELYDLRADPQEARNLVEIERDRVRGLVRQLPQESEWPPKRGEVSEETRSALRSLGYLSGETVERTEFGPDDDPKRAVELNQKVHGAIDRLRRGDAVGAERLAREVIAARPEMGIAWSYLAQALLERGRLEAAIDVMRDAHGRQVASAALRRQLALSLGQSGRYGEALAVLDTFGDTPDPEAQVTRAAVLSEGGRQDEARRLLERLVAEEPRHVGALETLALVALRQQRWGDALDRARQAVTLAESRGEAWNYLGTALYNLGDPPGALDAWERSAEVGSDPWDALFNLALVAGQIGDTPRAKRALERFVAGAPEARYGPDLERARGLLRQLSGS